MILHVEDPERTKNFFEQLGLAFKEEKHGSGPKHWACEAGGLVFEIYPKKATMPHGKEQARIQIL
jgi:lactoylglutathione lyase